MKVIATDLDRTLIPNGNHRQSRGAMALFRRLLKKDAVRLIYVTGRNERLVKDGITRYGLPPPAVCITEVGTSIYAVKGKVFHRDAEWEEKLRRDWHPYTREDIAAFLEGIDGIWQQEPSKLNPYKQSYYIDLKADLSRIMRAVRRKLASKKIRYELIESVDVNRNIGLLDILPRTGTKSAALQYVIKKMGVRKEDVLYSGDSGNDLLPLTSGCAGVLVRNASEKTRARLIALTRRKRLGSRVYLAKGSFKGLNGNYVGGIIEGAYHFGIFR